MAFSFGKILTYCYLQLSTFTQTNKPEVDVV